MTVQHLKGKKFAQESQREGISDELLNNALDEFLQMGDQGQQRYSLGAGLYKLRVASKEGKGKSGGARSLLAFKNKVRVVWLHVFSKNQKDNVTGSELKKLKLLSDLLLGMDQQGIRTLLELGELHEVQDHE